MSDTSVRHYMLITCIASSFLSAAPALADWSGKASQNRYNNQFGDFPPDDIDQHIKNSLDESNAPAEPTPTQSTDQVNPSQSVLRSPQYYQQPDYRNHNQQGNINQRPGNYRNNYNRPQSNNAGFNGPGNNSGSNFSMPWGNNNDSGFDMPWGNNNGSNNSMPWGNNNSSNNSMPWGNNNGSNFSMPWGNNNGNYGNR